MIRKPLKELVDELDPQQFWQTHRSTLVNLQAVAGLQRDFRSRLQLQLKQGGEPLTVAESYAHRVKQM
ncbi:LytTR family DNA-binding domain-containing protein [Roseateles sp. LYH14W]|uniref:LytTR family DNA-binding domain-containing protein n=1 Tax=Pelomonas parva TaxID=3299032 RepID=A0ABW7F6Y1_9BURK